MSTLAMHQNQMRVVHLHGSLREQFQEKFELVAATPSMAIRGLSHMVPGFRQAIEDGHFRVVIGKKRNKGRALSEAENLDTPWRKGETEIHLVPTIAGRKNGGAVKVLAGIAIIAVAVAAPYALGASMSGGLLSGLALSPGTLAASLGITWGTLAGAGVLLAGSGMAMMLSPQPKTDAGAAQAERPEDRPSYVFNGVTNTVEEGGVVPVVYGDVLVGSQVITAGLAPEDFYETGGDNLASGNAWAIITNMRGGVVKA